MSRRSRRQRRAQGPSKKAWGLRLLGIFLASLFLLVVAAYASIRGFLHSDGFRKQLSDAVGQSIDVQGDFAPFRWEGLTVRSAAYRGKGSRTIRHIEADALRAEVALDGINRGVWEIRNSSLRRLNLNLDLTAPPPKEPARERVPKPHAPPKRGWIPDRAELQDLEIGELNVAISTPAGPMSGSRMRLKLAQGPSPEVQQITIQGGDWQLPFTRLAKAKLNQLKLRHNRGEIFITDASIEAWQNGQIRAMGEIRPSHREALFQGEISQLKIEEILDETWAKRLTGDLKSSFSVQQRADHDSAHGRLVLQNGILTALPVLDILAAYADTRRFRILHLHEATTDWRYDDGTITLENIVLASEGLTRLEGRLVIHDQQLQGSFRLGIIPGILSRIPGAETDVFTLGERGLLWAPVQITGTLDDPKEDLSERLIAAAGLRLFEQLPESGTRVLKFTQSILGDAATDATQKALKHLDAELIDDGATIIREASGILGELIRPSVRPEPKKTK